MQIYAARHSTTGSWVVTEFQQNVPWAGKYDMIVLGSKGRSALADMLLGSVAQRVLTQAKQPVVLVK